MGYLHQLLLLPPTPAATHWVCLRHGSKQSSEVLLLAGRIFDGCTTPRVGNAWVWLRHNTAAGCGIRQMQALNNPIHLYFGSTFCWKRETLSFTNRIIMVKKRKKKKKKVWNNPQMNQMPDSNIRTITDTSRPELLPSVFCCQNAEHWLRYRLHSVHRYLLTRTFFWYTLNPSV